MKRISVTGLRPVEPEPSTYQAVDSDLPTIFWPGWDQAWQDFMNATAETDIPVIHGGDRGVILVDGIAPHTFMN